MLPPDAVQIFLQDIFLGETYETCKARLAGHKTASATSSSDLTRRAKHEFCLVAAEKNQTPEIVATNFARCYRSRAAALTSVRAIDSLENYRGRARAELLLKKLSIPQTSATGILASYYRA